MSAIIMDGKALAARIEKDLAERMQGRSRVPGLGVILIGDDPASTIYVRNKQRACERVGIHSVKKHFPSDIDEKEVIKTIDDLNADASIDAILIQLPLPKHIDEERVLMRVCEDKDVDGFHPANLGRLMRGPMSITPCTPKGIVRLLDEYKIKIESKNVVIVGRSSIVGRPLGLMLLHRNATITFCHSKTQDLASHTRKADILIAATGRAHLITKDHVAQNATVIDVGINRVNGKLVGDVSFAEVAKIASHITPVPGGVGPMTIAMLLENTLYRYGEHNAL